jgi:adenylosuccinate synthase
LSPLDVDDVVLVIRAFPIRVAGKSGDLPLEITWDDVTRESGHTHDVVERTTVTNRVRRVARFDDEVVRRAIAHNRPTRIALNHVDYVDAACARDNRLTNRAHDFVRRIENKIKMSIALLGFGPSHLAARDISLRKVGNE